MSHTPGPWVGGLQISSSSGSRIIAHIQTKEKKLQGYSNTNGVNPCEAKANAKLIAAAPELLTSLISLADHVDKLEGERICSGVWMQAKAVIKKATGEQA